MATLAVTATAYPALSPPRVRLDITASGTPAVPSVTVSRADVSGRSYPVRTSDGGPLPLSGGVGVLWDYEIPYGTTSTYAVAASGVATVTTTALLDVADVWLVHPGVPALSVRVPVVSEIGDLSRPVDRGLFSVVGRSDPIVVGGGARSSAAGTLAVRTRTDAERHALDLLLDDGSALLLNLPVTLGWGMETAYISVGDVTAARTVEYAPQPYREWTLPYQVVTRPAGGSQSERTWATVAAEYPGTWADVAATGMTWAELANPVT